MAGQGRAASAVKHFQAKLVKSFGHLGDAAESLDDFRYTKACFSQRKMLHSVAGQGGVILMEHDA
jgi:hypothetical protein